MAFYFLARYLCRNDLYFLGTKILGYGGNRVDPVFHRWFCDVLSDDISTLILLPRDHTKSTWGIATKVTQDIIKNPDWSILLATKTVEMSHQRLGVIKTHLETSCLSTLFPEILSPTPQTDAMSKTSRYKDVAWKADMIKVMRSSQQMEYTVETAGIGKSLTGHHYHRMYLDDLIDSDTVLSDTESANAMRFESELIPMKIDPGGLIFQYGTKWGAGDLYDWIQDRIDAKDDSEDKLNWRFIHREVMEELEVFSKYSEVDNAEFEKRIGYDKEDGKWKGFIYSYFDEDLLAQKREEAGNDFFFTAQYYNRIIGKDRLVFPPPYAEMHQDDFPKDLDYILTIDPAFVPSKTSDWTALVVCGYNDENKIYVAEAIRNKANPSELLEAIYGLYRKYEFRVGGMEKGSWEIVMEWVLEYARKEQGLPKLPLTGIQVSNMKDAKDSRIRAMSYFFKAGAVVLRYGLDDLKRELGKYPGNTRSKNDLVDALSMQRKLRSWKMQKDKRDTNEEDLLQWQKKIGYGKLLKYRDMFGSRHKSNMGYVNYG